MNQRKAKKKKTLNAERVAALDRIGFAWVRAKAPGWEEHFEALKVYKQFNDNKDPASDYIVQLRIGKTTRLGHWCEAQRRLRRNGKLSRVRFEQLDEIGFGWESVAPSPTKRKRGGKGAKDDDSDVVVVEVAAEPVPAKTSARAAKVARRDADDADSEAAVV